jgi:hypothetical protein
MAVAEEIFLAEVAKLSAKLAGDQEMIVDHQTHVSPCRYWQNGLCH